MDLAVLDQLGRRCRGELLRDEPLWRHTTWQVGGPAAALFRPANQVDLVRAVRLLSAAGVPWVVIGGGSNLLVRDGGFAGVVLDLKALAEVRVGADGLVEAGAGARLNALVKQLVAAGLGGLEQLAGIPGTVGGAVVMNAGAGGQSLGQVVTEVEVLADETFAWRPAAELGFAYRHSALAPDEVVTAVRLQLRAVSDASLKTQVPEPISACMLARLRQLKFPRHKSGPTMLQFPYQYVVKD